MPFLDRESTSEPPAKVTVFTAVRDTYEIMDPGHKTPEIWDQLMKLATSLDLNTTLEAITQLGRLTKSEPPTAFNLRENCGKIRHGLVERYDPAVE